MPFRDDQGVAGRDRVSVVHGHGKIVGGNDAGRVESAEGAGNGVIAIETIIEIRFPIAYSENMKTQTIKQTGHSYNGTFKPGARPPKRLSAAARKQLDEAVPSTKAREIAARFAKSKVIVES